MGSTSSETPPSSSACGTDQESSHKIEPNPSSISGNIEAFPFSCFKPKPRLPRDSDSDEVDKLTRFINDDMEFISEVSEKIRDYDDEIPELKRTFDELLFRAKNATPDDCHAVPLAYELYFLQGKVTNLKARLSAKASEAEALKKMIRADQSFDSNDRLGTRRRELDINGGTVVEFRDLKRKFKKEKQRITSKEKHESKEKEEEEEEEEEPESIRYDQTWSHVIGTAHIKGGHAALEKMPNLSKSSALAESSVFKDFKARYNELGIDLKQCLLCFSVFPESAEIKRRVMTYWWIGEGFVPPLGCFNSYKSPDDYANDFFYELIAKDFIEPSSKGSPSVVSLVGVKTCKMNPFVRSMVIVLAERANFFDFDSDMNVTSDYTSSHRACLTSKQLDFNTRDLNLLYTLFNVSEPVLAFNPDSFRRMKYVKVLYLGRWQTWSTYHVDILFLDVLGELGDAKNLRFLSLQRMSKMMELPDTILKLKNLTILDIRACQNLEEIPNGIDSLVNLTHLDMSECYLLDHMPKGLSSLTNLQALGGFVVGESDDSADDAHCVLADLKSMKRLRKLSIDTGVEKFPSHSQLCHLNKLEMLRKLTIAWGRGYVPNSSAPAEKDRTIFNELKEKLLCFPRLKAPKCLWDKGDASPKENSGPKPSPKAEVGKDNIAPKPPPAAEVGKGNSFPEPPPVVVEEARKDNSAPKPPLAEEVGKDYSELKPTTEAIGKDNSSPKPPLPTEEESRRDNSALEPLAAKEEAGKINSAPELAVAEEARRDNSAPKPTPATEEEIRRDNSAPKPATTVEETQGDNSVPKLAIANEDRKDKSALDATSTNEIGKARGEVGKYSSTPELPPPVEETKKDNSAPESAQAKEVGKDDRAPGPTLAHEVSKSKTEQKQEPAEVKVAAKVEVQARTTLEENHVCFPWMKALKRSTKADQTSASTHDHQSEAKLPLQLEKLDLRCFPNNKDTNQEWLKSGNLPNLKKLYIRGGKCFELGANSGAGDGGKGTNQTDQKECWNVEVLRLKHLADLKMEWKELQRLFPNLSYLEMVNCPKLSFFPCDENGVWMKK